MINVLHLHHENVQRGHSLYNGGHVCIRDLRESTTPIPQIDQEKKCFSYFQEVGGLAINTFIHSIGIAPLENHESPFSSVYIIIKLFLLKTELFKIPYHTFWG